jgi:predicted FMN-binding regulatory protein PaiB
MPEYLADRYRTTEPEQIRFLIDEFPFVTLVPELATSGEMVCLPLILDQTSASVVLFGHVDNSNPFLPHLDGKRVSAIFHGPNGYISPVDYVSRQFPTWNYAMARIDGVSSLIDQESQKMACMAEMVERLEARNGSNYQLDPSSEQIQAVVRRITFFRLQTESMYGIFKFSQEKSAADRKASCDSLIRKLRLTQNRTLPRLAAYGSPVRGESS